MSENRPDPDELLRKAKEEESQSFRGKLKIYLGMAAGVGKTYAMLSDGIDEAERGVEVVAGYIEPHGRAETEQLGETLEKIALRTCETNGVLQREFDLDLALKRKPKLILVDELAHSNASGSRHAKRWQDINELLDAGISVYTTVNIQHLESLKDTVAQITGVVVHETVPDTFLQRADEIELVDIPPSELIRRLKEGKVYPRERIETALRNFFKEGNLLALRELVLRHSAKSVDAQIQRFRRRNSVEVIWPTTQRLMVLVGPTPMAETLVRSAHNLAQSMNAELLAVSFATAATAALPVQIREYSSSALQLAESLGCETVISSSDDMVAETLRMARERNISAIVLGRSVRSRWYHLIKRQFSDELIRLGDGISFHIINARSKLSTPEPSIEIGKLKDWRTFVEPTNVVLGATLVALLMFSHFELSNIIMIYLGAVTWIAARFGYFQSAFASILAVGLFDFLFVPPHFTFAVSDIQYLVTFSVMLGVSLIITWLTQSLKVQTQSATDRERRTAALFALARGLLSAQNRTDLVRISRQEMRRALSMEVDVLAQNQNGLALTGMLPIEPQEEAVARWVYEHNLSAGRGTNTLPGANSLYLPIGSAESCEAVLRVKSEETEELSFEKVKLIEAYAAQISLGLERIRSQELSDAAERNAELDRVRNTLLSSVSHDLRTPLSIICGSAQSLLQANELGDAQRMDLTRQIQIEAERLSRIVNNVLELTKIESGGFKPREDWCSVEELIGSSLDHARVMLAPRQVVTSVAQDLPLLMVDAVLLDQALVNILENVARHTPDATTVEISAYLDEKDVVIEISDNGPGLPPGSEDRVFEKLFRAAKSKGGIGLGLTVSKMVVELLGGQITARNRATGGATFQIRLPGFPTSLSTT